MPIAPGYLIGVMADRRKLHWFERHQFAGLEDAEGIGWFQTLLTAAGARTVIAKVLPGVNGSVAVVPFDDQAVVAVFFQGYWQEHNKADCPIKFRLRLAFAGDYPNAKRKHQGIIYPYYRRWTLN